MVATRPSSPDHFSLSVLYLDNAGLSDGNIIRLLANRKVARSNDSEPHVFIARITRVRTELQPLIVGHLNVTVLPIELHRSSITL